MSSIKILGAYSTKEYNHGTSSYLIEPSIALDAGNLMRPLGRNAAKIDHIVLTHCHMEHLADIPFLIDAFFAKRNTPLNIYGLEHTLANLKRHIFNGEVWPDFTKIALLNSHAPSIIMHTIKEYKPFCIKNVSFKPIPALHAVPTVGFVITKRKTAIYITSDTCYSQTVWNEINENGSIRAVIIECTYPSAMSEAAKIHGHLTSSMVIDGISKCHRKDIEFFVSHINPKMERTIIQELLNSPLTANVTVLKDGDEINF
ncbi:MAG: MBL fold metallo-hydrolase [Helicobacteraceae bacterium]|nr:MBL fold metallo-hydrolase [Helicobacteraceae bacterium]